MIFHLNLCVETMLNNAMISVIIPVYNGERYLTAAIESVLVQTHTPGEIIVIDDGSTDESAKIAQRFAPIVHYRWQSHGGISAARNRGVELACGNFLAFLDADDLWMEDKLARQVATFSHNPTLEAVFGHIQQFYSPELDEESKRQIAIPVEAVRGFHAGAMLIKREAFLRVGLFNSDLQLAEFIDWYARAMELQLKSLMLPDVVMKRRIHRTNQGMQYRGARGDYVRVLKAALDRRREQGKS